MSYIDRAVMDLIARGQSSRLLPASGKIYDITHADTAEHSVPLPTGYPENTKAIWIRAVRVSGTGYFSPISVSGGFVYYILSNQGGLWIRAVDGLFYYSLSVANDDWDIYGLGHFAS